MTPELKADYTLHLADVKHHSAGDGVTMVDVTSYEQVLGASRGMDAIINFTVVHNDSVQSFEVNVKGAYHVMRAAAETGIQKVIHTDPQAVRSLYDHDFDVNDVPPAPDTGLYSCTKHLSNEICRIYAREHDIQTITLLFNELGPKPSAPIVKGDFPPFSIVWEDLQHAIRLALEVKSVPGNFQVFNLLSYHGHGKFSTEKAKRLLGYAPLEQLEAYYKRVP